VLSQAFLQVLAMRPASAEGQVITPSNLLPQPSAPPTTGEETCEGPTIESSAAPNVSAQPFESEGPSKK
jgi:hypothetical protein